MDKIAVIIASDQGAELGLTIQHELPQVELFATGEREHCTPITSIPAFVAEQFTRYDAFVFIGALGICVRQSPHAYIPSTPTLLSLTSTPREIT